jgi:DNA polymerase-3 subunit epsilon
MGWFKKHTDHPEFYKSYLDAFKNQSEDVTSVRFVVFDTETTGLDVTTDRILSIGAVGVTNFQIHVADTFECYLKQETFNTETVKIHGLLKAGPIEKVDEAKAIEGFLDYLGNAILVAHHAAFDVAMINAALKRMDLPKLKNKVIDTGELYKKTKYVKDHKHYSLDALSDLFNVTKHDRHTASGDAYITALLFVKIASLLRQKKKGMKLRYLLGWTGWF